MLTPFLQYVSEARIVRRQDDLSRYTYQEIEERVFLSFLALAFLKMFNSSKSFAKQYANATMTYGGFERVRTTANDLHNMLAVLDGDKKIGPKKFFLKLINIDPLIKNKINPADSQRSIRAYEIKSFTKKSIFEWFKKTKSNYDEGDFYKIYIDYPRNELLKKIEIRAREMIKNGAVREVKKFSKLKIIGNKTANKAIGIAEIKAYLVKKIDIHEVIEKISIKTRQYAKRQVTWSRGNMLEWNKLRPNSIEKFLKNI